MKAENVLFLECIDIIKPPVSLEGIDVLFTVLGAICEADLRLVFKNTCAPCHFLKYMVSSD